MVLSFLSSSMEDVTAAGTGAIQQSILSRTSFFGVLLVNEIQHVSVSGHQGRNHTIQRDLALPGSKGHAPQDILGLNGHRLNGTQILIGIFHLFSLTAHLLQGSCSNFFRFRQYAARFSQHVIRVLNQRLHVIRRTSICCVNGAFNIGCIVKQFFSFGRGLRFGFVQLAANFLGQGRNVALQQFFGFVNAVGISFNFGHGLHGRGAAFGVAQESIAFDHDGFVAIGSGQVISNAAE
mmetsp:Transcript_30113/g.82733  ORF Transcript_30113/g.82733 Transcript_30113/m.82733 type:complete len:236 (+) Transcript_30113:950-1657(+)